MHEVASRTPSKTSQLRRADRTSDCIQFSGTVDGRSVRQHTPVRNRALPNVGGNAPVGYLVVARLSLAIRTFIWGKL
jgi:hypothetical protein